jgi:hypothetical protein
MTPQMLTLGRDASDDMHVLPATAQPGGGAAIEKEGDKPWWKTMKNPFVGEGKSQSLIGEDSSSLYASLEERRPSPPGVEMEDQKPRHRKRFADHHETSQYASLPGNETSRGENGTTMPEIQPARRNQQGVAQRWEEPLLQKQESGEDGIIISDRSERRRNHSEPTPEDILQQDCNFFYRDIDDQKQKHRRGWQARVLVREGSPGIHQPSFEYSQAVTVLSPPVLQRFRSKFEQLNQVIASPRYDAYDLDLSEHDSGLSWQPHHAILRSDTVETSSLFYQHNGKMLMRLPRDQVRLLMDPDLEAGILSVEQCRNEKDDPNVAGAKPDHPLRYILTVDDDLYRTIVSEMSDELTEPYCGLNSCCLEDEKMDIRVAVVLIIVVLLVLLTTTLGIKST